jgi:transposase
MLGPAKPRCLGEPIAISLEDLVPPNHFYRHLEAKLDLSFVREWTRELYAERGRPSIDPVVFFKLQLVMFFEGIRSERQLIETASLNLAHRWYLGYALDEPHPDHSSLTRIRQRLGIDVFQRFFEQVVDLCQVTGDTTYGTTENLVALEDAGIRAFFPLPDFDRRTAFFGRDAFAYDAAADVYQCLQGQFLRRRTIKYTEQEVVYRAKAATCNTCLVKAACTASNHGRTVHRSLYEDYLEKVRGYHETEAYKKAMRKRQV